MTEEKDISRYRLEKFQAASLERNPAGSPVERFLHIYLPPGYDAESDRKYPVIYFLHGYAGNYHRVTVGPKDSYWGKIAGVFPPELLAQIDVGRMAFYEVFDELIERGDLPPFIFVQPDGSLHLPHLNNTFDFFTGQTSTKGSFYINSASTGKFGDYIAHDVINYIDSHFRTIADSRHRAIAGASMGGYGTLCLCLDYPGTFSAAAALSPGNFTVDSVCWQLHIPFMEKLLGKEIADKSDSGAWADILDTVDLVYSPGRRLLPTIRKDDNGRVLGYDREAAQRWEEHDINILLARNPGVFKNIPLQVNCSRDDEFSLAGEAAKLHLTLQQLRINHEFDFYSDPAAALSPHILGIAYRVLPAIRFCLPYIS